MAVHFEASLEYIDHGSAPALDDIDPLTLIMWFNPQQVDQLGRRFMRKGGNLQALIGNQGSNGQVIYERTRATTNTVLLSNGSVWTTSAWQFLAIVDAETGGANRAELWRGTLSSPPLLAGMTTQTIGTGAVTSDAGSNMLIGSRDIANTHSDAHIATVWIYNAALTGAQIGLHWHQPSLILANCVLKVNYFDQNHIHDLSGGGNQGSVNGTPIDVNHVPLGPAFFVPKGYQGNITIAVEVLVDDAPVVYRIPIFRSSCSRFLGNNDLGD